MDFIRALRHHAPTTSSAGSVVAHSSSEGCESPSHQSESASTSSAENSSLCVDADVVSGGLTHFLEAECFFSRMTQLLDSAQQLCTLSRVAHTIRGVHTCEQPTLPAHISPVIGPQGARENQGSFKKSQWASGTERNLVHDGQTTRIERVVCEVSACIKNSVSAVVFCVATLEIYQSQPTLLDPYLSQIVKPLAETVASNIELLTPLSTRELEAELSKIISHSTCEQCEIAAPVEPRSIATASGSSSSSSSTSVSSCFTASSSSPVQSPSASGAPISASSLKGSLCTSPNSYLRESNYTSPVDQEASAEFTAPSSNLAARCVSASRAAPPTTAGATESHCRKNEVSELEDLFLRTTASVALRLLLHVLYVVNRVRGYKSVRQLLPSEPELLEVLVDHCETLLAAEFLHPFRSAAAAETLSAANPASAAASVYEEPQQQSNGFVVSSRAATEQGAFAEKDTIENKRWRGTEALLIQQMRTIIELLRQLPLWSTHYSLLVWLSLLVLAPFDLESLDSSASSDAYTQGHQKTAAGTLPPQDERTLAQAAEGQPAAPPRHEIGETDNNGEATLRNGQKFCSLRHQLPLGSRTIVLVEGYLRNTSSKASDAAAFVVARFFSRPDVCTKAAGTFSAFLQFCQDVLNGDSTCTVVNKRTPSEAAPSSCCQVLPLLRSASDSVPLFAKANALRALHEILKSISRASALPELPRLLRLVGIGGAASSHAAAGATAQRTAASLPQSVQQGTSGEEEEKSGTEVALSEAAAKSALFRKLRCSCAARICMLLLPPVGSEAYRWRYTRHARNLEAYLKQSQQQPQAQALQQQQHNVPESPSLERECAANRASDAIPRRDIQEAVQEDDVPDAVEEVVGLLLDSLADRDTIVRWAAAKAIGRVVLQLPRSFATQVVASILDRMEDAMTCQTADEERLWHGSCLALGELLRRGLVDPAEHLAACTSRLCCALALDKSGGGGRASQSSSHSAAAAAAEQLRDAACFAVWSLARAYHHTEALQQQLKPLSEALLLVALFDRAVNCRRAAAAAFQELEGRQSGILHGLQIVTTADFFALATRRSAYLKVAPQVALLDSSYCDLLLKTLVHLLLQQSDEEMRTLAAAGIKRIARLKERAAVERFIEMLLKKAAAENESLITRHGAMLGLTAFIEALGIVTGEDGERIAAARVTASTRDDIVISGDPAARRQTPASASTRESSTAAAPRDHHHAQGGPTSGSTLGPSAEKTATSSAASAGGSAGAPVAGAAAGQVGCLLGDKLQTSLRQLVVHIEKQRLYRGKGGDVIRSGVCVFIKALATSSCIAFKPATARRYIVTLLEGLRHFSDDVQLAAAEALRALLRTRMAAEQVLQEVVPQLLQHLQNPSEHVAARRGYALALATLPAEVYRRACSSPPRQQQGINSRERPDLLTVLETEAVSFAPLGCPSLGDAQTRRNALIALAFALRALVTLPPPSVSAAVARGRTAAQENSAGGENDVSLRGGIRAAAATPAATTGAPEGAQSRTIAEGSSAAGETANTGATPGRLDTRTSTAGAQEDGSAATAAAAPSTGTTAVLSCGGELNGSASGKDRAEAAQPLQPYEGKGTAEVCGVNKKRSRELFNASTLERLCNTLETCSVDYQIDRRGDVGSWVREVAAEVVTFLLENLQTACTPPCSLVCAGDASPEREPQGEQQVTPTNSRHTPGSNGEHTRDAGQSCARTRLLSILIRMSLENLDRTRSRAVFLLYHLLAPLPISVVRDGSLPPTPFKVEWIWNRVFYDFSYEAVSASLTPRPDLLQAGPSPCFLLRTEGRTAPREAATAATKKAPVPAGSVAAISAPAATLTGCALLVTVLQHALLPLAEKQANALESVKPRVPFHNLNLSEFAENSCNAAAAAAGSMRRTEEPLSATATVQANDNLRRAVPATPARRNGTVADAAVDAMWRVCDTNTERSFLVQSGSQENRSVAAVPLCGRDADEAGTAAAANRIDNHPSQQVSAAERGGTGVVEKRGSCEGNAKGPPGIEEDEVVDQLYSCPADEGSFDFLLEASVGDGGRASLHKTRKAGVLLRLPLFTDSALTYPPLLQSLLMPPPFCQAAAQGLCLGVGAYGGRSSERAAQALLAFLTELRQAVGTGTGGGANRDGEERAEVHQEGERNKQQTRFLVAGPCSATRHMTEQQAANDLLHDGGGIRPPWEEKTTAHKVAALVVDVLEDSGCVPAEKARKGETRTRWHNEKTCLAALRTTTLISNFLSKDDRCRVLELLMNTLDDGIWRRSFQYAKARCEALIALLAAGSVSAPLGFLCDGTTKERSLFVEMPDSAVATAQNARTTHRKALCAALQYLTHSFLKVRQVAAEELYASLLLPLSATHSESLHDGASKPADSTEATTKTKRTTCRSTNQSDTCPPFVLTAPQVEEACHIVAGTPWMELRSSDTEAVEILVRLFDVCAEWDEMRRRGGAE